jgi:MFS family permease
MVAFARQQTIPWPKIIGLAMSQLVAWGVLFYAFAVVVIPMGEETGWTKPQMHGAQSLGLVMSGMAAYPVGRWIDRTGGRGLMTAGAMLGTLAVLLWSQVSALWQLYFVFILIGVASSMMLYEAAFAVTARLVPGNYRRAIIAITLLGGLASTAFIPVTHWLVDGLGWRNALQILAAILVLFCVGIPWFSLRETQQVDVKSDGKRGNSRLFAEVQWRPTFWFLLFSYVSFAFFFSTLLFNLLPMLSERGMSMAAAVAIYALIGPSQVAGRLGMFFLDRILNVSLAGITATLLPVAAMLVLVLQPVADVTAPLFAILFGAGMGIKTVVQATAAPELLKISEYGALQGLLSTPVQITQAVTPFLAALIWQWSGGYALVELLLTGAALLSSACFAAAVWLSRRG